VGKSILTGIGRGYQSEERIIDQQRLSIKKDRQSPKEQNCNPFDLMTNELVCLDGSPRRTWNPLKTSVYQMANELLE
jgi:hypothetical protein